MTSLHTIIGQAVLAAICLLLLTPADASFGPDADFSATFDSTVTVAMVILLPLSRFNGEAFKQEVYDKYLLGVLPGDVLNTDRSDDDDGGDGADTTPVVAENATITAARKAAKDALFDSMVILEVCGFDVTNRNDLLTADSAFYDWPLQRCGETYNGINNMATTYLAGTLVRFSFLSVPWMARRTRVGDGGYTAGEKQMMKVLGVSTVGSNTDDHIVAMDRKFLANHINWMALIGHRVPADGSSTKSVAPSPPAQANLPTMAYTPHFGTLKERPLATVATWGDFARPQPRNIAEAVASVGGVAVVLVVVGIVLLVIVGVCCCCYYKFCRDSAPDNADTEGTRVARRRATAPRRYAEVDNGSPNGDEDSHQQGENEGKVGKYDEYAIVEMRAVGRGGNSSSTTTTTTVTNRNPHRAAASSYQNESQTASSSATMPTTIVSRAAYNDNFTATARNGYASADGGAAGGYY